MPSPCPASGVGASPFSLARQQATHSAALAQRSSPEVKPRGQAPVSAVFVRRVLGLAA